MTAAQVDCGNPRIYCVAECSKRIHLYSLSGILLRNDIITVWKSFYPVVNVGLSEMFEIAMDAATRLHIITSISPYQLDILTWAGGLLE